MANQVVHVLLTYQDGNDEACCDVFASRQAVVDYVLDVLRQAWEEMHWEEVGESDRQSLYDEQDEARKALDEHGWWRDGAGETVYVYEEKEVKK